MPSFSFERLRRRLAALRPGARDRSRAEGASEEESGQEPLDGFETARLGELHETRRESLRRRLASIRERPRPRGRLDPAAIGRSVAGAGRGLLTGLGALARGARDALAGAGSAIGDLWFMLPLAARQRIAAAAALLAAAALAFFVLLPLAPCWVPGGDRCPPADEAIAHVPGDVAAYVHVNLDPDTDQYEAASEVAGRLPNLAAAASTLLSLAVDRELRYDVDIQPWSGGELAFVLDAAGPEISRMLIVEVANEEGAIGFSRRVLGSETSTTELEGTTIEIDEDGLAAAVADGFLLLGTEQLVRTALELPVAESLEVEPAADAALGALPDDNLLDAYLAPEFASELVGRPDFRSFDTFLSTDSSEGVAAALSFDREGVGLTMRSLQDPERAEADPDFFSALPLFEPELVGSVAGDALVYLGVGDPGASAATLVARAAATAPDLFAGLQDFKRRLRQQGGVDIEADLLPLLEGEAALTVEPQSPSGGESTPGVIGETGVPYLALLASGVDTEAAIDELGELQVPIAEAVDPASGQAPVFEAGEIDGTAIQSLRLSPVVDLTYAAVGEELIVATSPVAIERARGDGQRLADSDAYEAVTADFPDQVSMMLYLGFRDLLVLGERLFLAEDPSYARFAVDLRTLEAAALAVTRTRTELATDVRVSVGEPEAPEEGPPTLEFEPD